MIRNAPHEIGLRRVELLDQPAQVGDEPLADRVESTRPLRRRLQMTDFAVSNRTKTRDPMGNRVKAAGNTDPLMTMISAIDYR